MSWRGILSVPAVLILLLLGLSLKGAGAHGTGPAPPVAPRLDKTRQNLLAVGGPDPFGYTYVDSNEPDGALFNWLDTTDGTALSLSSSEPTAVDLPFPFSFYGYDFHSVAVYHKGVLFLDTPPLDLPVDNEPLSTTQLTNLIAPFWDNLDAGEGTVYHKTLGRSPDRRFVVAWHGWRHDSFEATSATVTFEVILYEGTNNIKFQYSETAFGDESWDDGGSATAGIRQSGSNYLQYSHDQDVLHSGMAICFQYPESPACDLPPQIDVFPTQISATQLAGEVTTHTMTIGNSGDHDLSFSLAEIPPWVATTPVTGTVPGRSSLQATIVFTAPEEVHDTYTATLRVSSNDPLAPEVDLPLTMTVVLPPRLSIAKRPSAERVNAGSLLTYTLTISNAGGPVGNVSVSDTLPSETLLAWSSDGGTRIGDEILWNDLHLPENAKEALSYAVTVTCVPSGTEIVNQDYQIKAPDWPPPVQGQAITVTAMAEGTVAKFDAPVPILRQEPVAFTNLSQNATSFLWSFGDGLSSSLHSPIHTFAEQGTYTAILTASNLCSVDEYSRALSVEDLALVMAPTQATSHAVPGQTAMYTLSLTNTGTLSDTVTLALSGQLWSTALSTNTVGPLSAGSRGAFRVLVTVPPNAVPGELDQVTVQAVSSVDPRQPPASATTVLTTMARPYALYLPLIFR